MRRSRLQYDKFWAQIGLGAMLFLGALLVYLVFNVSRFQSITDINALDYAQIARHVARGDGFVTSFVKPLSLVYNQEVEGHPELTYPPLHIWWSSMVMRALGATEQAAAHGSGLAFVLTVPLVFFLGLRLFDPRTASLATVFYITNSFFLEYAISGLESSLLALLVTGLLLVLYLAAKAGQREMVFVAVGGVLLGLIYLTKYVWVLAGLPALVYLLTMNDQRRLARAAVFLGLALLVALPWLIRNQRLTGNPFFTLRSTELLSQTKAYPGNSLYRSYADYIPGFVAFAVQNPKAIFEKVRSGLAIFYLRIAVLAGAFLTPFFLVAILVRLGDEDFERWRNTVYAVFIVITLALTLLIAAPRLLAPLGPVITVIATAYFWRLLEERTKNLEHRKRGRAVTAAVVVLLAAHMFPFLMAVTPGQPARRPTPSPLDTAYTQLRERTAGAIVTDIPWLVAWKVDREALWLPQTEVELRKVENAVGPFRWMFLSPRLSRLAAVEGLDTWRDLWRASQRADVRHGDFVVRGRLGDGRWILFERTSSPQ